jgi:hypothetical protein
VSDWTRLDRGLWAHIMRELDPGTDLHAAVLAIAPITWDDDLTTATTVDLTLRQLAMDFPLWHLWRPPSPDGGQPLWGARTGKEVFITGTAAELRSALTHYRDTGRYLPVKAEVFFPKSWGL